MEKNTKINKSTHADDNKKSSKKNNHVGPEEFEETRSDKIRMKPQPFDQAGKSKNS